MFRKRAGTSGIRGQLYETKLISLLYFRAIHDDTIEEFQLASNIDGIGAFDDICFKAKVKDYEKPIAVFIQAKHRENKEQAPKNDLLMYFDSYLKMRQQFNPSNTNLFFNGTFDETECIFVIYTTAKNKYGNKAVTSTFSSILNRLIDTMDSESVEPRGTTMPPHKQEENMEFLCKLAMEQQFNSLAKRLTNFIYNEENFQTMLSDKLVLLYHIILAQKVLEISEIQLNGHRIATFREDFFDVKEEYLVLFRDALYKEILKRRTIEPIEVNYLLSEFLAEPTDAKKLSKLIGTVVTYKNGQLEFDKQSTYEFKPQLHEHVPRSTVNKAVELAAKGILLSQRFKVPATFGNKDLIINGTDADIEKILNYLTSTIIDLLKKSKSSDTVFIDESFVDEFLQLNGVIAGAIGNIFVRDDNSKLLKITDKWESLEALAQRLYKKLIAGIHNLHEYKFSFKVNKLPKLSFECNEHEVNLVSDFLNRLLFYSKQADENGVETNLKNEIEDYQRVYTNYFQVKTDAIFLRYHDEIQKWWMQSKEATYLTRESDVFKKALNNIIDDPLMCSVNITYMSKIKQYSHTFSEDAVRSMKLKDDSGTVIITDDSVLTAVKVLQHLKNKDHAVLDFEYIATLPANDRNALRTELSNTKYAEKIMILVCDKLRNTRNEMKLLENISKAASYEKTIVITNDKSFEILKKYFANIDNTVRDAKNSLLDLNEESQKTILESARVMFQGTEVGLDLIVDDESKGYVRGDILNKVISEDKIVVGKLNTNRNYNEIKQFYIDRRLKKNGQVAVVAKNLFDILDDIVLVIAEPGMGKSTLLTQLSLKTKEIKPEVWIIRINLLEYSGVFRKWNEKKTAIDLLETLNFICQVIIRDKLGKDNNLEIELIKENNAVHLKHCSGDQWTEFELKLFLNFYNKGKLIVLLDGFDEICPYYTNEVIHCINSIRKGPRENRMWITSRSYNEVKNILQREFGSSYEIENFTYTEMQQYLNTIWEYNLRLEELNSSQLENVKNFIEYMSQLEDVKLYGFAMQLYTVYITAARYLLSEIKDKNIPLLTGYENYDGIFGTQAKKMDGMSSFLKDNCDGNPLHLLLSADFVESNIKIANKDSNVWNVELNTFMFYERFIEMKIKTIRFQEKSGMNIFYPDILITYDKELSNFNTKHKKLAAYAIFKQHSHKLFSAKDLEEINETIRVIEKGGEKTGVIYNVADEVPIFVLTEYFTVEYICDCVKKENDSEKLISWIDFIFNEMFSIESYINIRNLFDYKMKADKTLTSVLEKNDKAIFNLIMEQGRVYSEYIRNMYKSHQDIIFMRSHWALSDAVSQQLQNLISFFVKTLKIYINASNLDEFLEIIKVSQVLVSAYTYKSEALITYVIDVVREIDGAKFTSVLLDNFSFLSHATISSYVEMSNHEIVKQILACEDCSEPQLSASRSSGYSSEPYTSSIPSQPSISSLARSFSISSLPRDSFTSSLASRPVAKRRQSV